MDSSFLLSEDLNIAIILYLFVWYFAHSLFLPLNEFEQVPGDSEGQGSLVCYSPWSCKELDTTEQLNTEVYYYLLLV